LALKGEEQKRKAAKDATDAQLRQMELETNKEIELNKLELEAHKFGANMAKDKNKEAFDKEKLAVDVDIAGHKMGMEAAKSRDQIDTQKEQIVAQILASQMNTSKQKKDKE
jgi:hypothetical protein